MWTVKSLRVWCPQDKKPETPHGKCFGLEGGEGEGDAEK